LRLYLWLKRRVRSVPSRRVVVLRREREREGERGREREREEERGRESV